MEISVKDINTSFVKMGTGEAVVILPGWGATSPVYKILTQQLSSKYTVYVLDLPGFGITPEPSKPWCIDDYCDFVTEFITKNELKSITLIGHSYGGRIAIKLCNRELPFEIKKLVLMDAAGIKTEKSKEQQSKEKKYGAIKKMLSSKPMKKLMPNAIDNIQKMFGSADYAAASPLMRETMVLGINEDLTDLIPNISVDTLLLWGRNDTATPINEGMFMHENIKGSVMEIFEESGHFPFVDQPFEFRKVIAKHFGIE